MGQTRSNSAQMVTNGGVDVDEVWWSNNDSLACVGVQNKVSGKLKVSIKCSNIPKNELKPPLALLVNYNSSNKGMGVHLS